MRDILSVSRLNALAATMLEHNFPDILVEGEISNLICANSGHWYFSLKDDQAQARCAMFRYSNQLVRFRPENGHHVVLKAKVSLYQTRGDYQLIVQRMESAGAGVLQQRFEQLKHKLAMAGWFALELKKNIPVFPSRIGVITSPTGAVIRDIAHVLARRCPSIEIVIYPSLVQGEKAAAELVHMIHLANQLRQVDLLILARGGGSLEDLWPFNEEIVAEALWHSTLPVISAVGHETDVTIADFVADQRAPTPSAAAEIASPDMRALRDRLQKSLVDIRYRLDTLVQNRVQTLDRYRIQLQHPGDTLQQHRLRLNQLCTAMQQSMDDATQRKREQWMTLLQSLDQLGPLKTLQRGYAWICKVQHRAGTEQAEKTHVASAKQLAENDLLEIRLQDGRCTAKIQEIL